jgi:hypothetical protein
LRDGRDHRLGLGTGNLAIVQQEPEARASDLETARRRVREHSLPLENLRAREAYGQNSRLNKTLEIYGEMPGRIPDCAKRGPGTDPPGRGFLSLQDRRS